MKSEEIIVIINEICARIGATSENFMPKLVAYGKLTYGYGFLVCIFFIVILGFITLYLKKRDEDFVLIPVMLSIIPALISLLFLYDLITWSIAPEVKSVLYILRMIGG